MRTSVRPAYAPGPRARQLVAPTEGPGHEPPRGRPARRGLRLYCCQWPVLPLPVSHVVLLLPALREVEISAGNGNFGNFVEISDPCFSFPGKSPPIHRVSTGPGATGGRLEYVYLAKYLAAGFIF